MTGAARLAGFLILGSLSLSPQAEGPKRTTLAALRLESRGPVASSVTQTLDDFLSAQLFATGAYDLVPRETVERVTREFGRLHPEGCEGAVCLAEMGRAMGARKILAGSVSRLGRTYVLSFRLLDAERGKEELLSGEDCRCALDDLTGKIREIVKRLPEVAGSISGSAPSAQGTGSPIDRTEARPDRGEPRGRDGAAMGPVPVGEFQMGASENDPGALDSEKPRHRVFLDAFHIDVTEVTVARYREFLDSVKREGHRWCAGGEQPSHDHTPSYWDDPRWTGLDQPVVGVDWYDAYAYCSRAGKRLPTEAEWEKAARGTDERIYPWGNEYDGKLSNGGNMVGRTTPAGSYPKGAGPYGMLDLAGNVWEWVQDWYDDASYRSSPIRNPPGAASGSLRVIRGGSWNNEPRRLRATCRGRIPPTYRLNDVGFRCAQDR